MKGDGSVFVYSVRGTIEGAEGLGGDDLYVNYCFNYGQDWELVAGVKDAVSQINRQGLALDGRVVWNFPIEVTFTSTNPYGWPQLVLNVYGKSYFGHEIIRGYAAVHLPITPGQHTKRVKCFTPSSASYLQQMVSWVTGNVPEFVDPKMVAQARGREVTRVESQGHVNLSLTVTFKDFARLGYDCGAPSPNAFSCRNLLATIGDSEMMTSSPASESRNFGKSEKSSKGGVKLKTSKHSSMIPEETATVLSEDTNGNSSRSRRVRVVDSNDKNNVSQKGFVTIEQNNERKSSFSGKELDQSSTPARKKVPDGEAPSTSGISKTRHEKFQEQILPDENSFDEDSDNDSSDKERVRTLTHRTQIHHQEELEDVSDYSRGRVNETPIKLPRKVEASPNGKNKSPKISEPSVAFSKPSTSQIQSEGSSWRKRRDSGISPSKNKSEDEERKKSLTALEAFVNKDDETQKRGSSGRPQAFGLEPLTGREEKDSSGALKKTTADLFSARKNQPAPLPRKSMLQPISKPLPKIMK